MNSNLVFSIFLLFLSWGLQGFSQETPQKDGKTGLDEGTIASLFDQVKQQSDEAKAIAGVEGGSSEGEMITCMQKLMPCQSHIHSSSPPKTCCAPLKDIVTKDSRCMCKVFHNQDLLKTVNVTMKDALALSKACGAKVDTSVCKNATSPTASAPTQSTLSIPIDIATEILNKSKSGSLSNNSSDSSESSSEESNANAKITGVNGVVWSIASIATIMFSTFYM